ncbi:MAG: hypothetical protein EZS28_021822 [Streblomastix strix]|uniref:SH3 domain-containing protein n=1 Tax=Streblomastix strix TaxID=222440 RepID=A0A5J4VJI1_9EUKA|nr:MAG: hypothetical protein EZS28_021822 [Streblomastix strix]
MSNTDEEYLEAQIDCAGQKGDAEYISISKGDIIHLINKGLEYCIVEKGGKVGKVPCAIFKFNTSENVQISENAIQTTSTSQIATQISIDNSTIPEKIETELFEFNVSGAIKIVNQIFSSNQDFDVDNNIKMKWLTTQFTEASDDKLKENFNVQFQITIKDNLNSCQSIHEIALLDIIEIIAERGTNIPLEGQYSNKRTVFFDSMKNSVIILLNFKQPQKDLIFKDKFQVDVNNYCRACLARIHNGEDEEGYSTMIKLNYVRALSENIGNSGSNQNEEDFQVWCGLDEIKCIFNDLSNGREQTNHQTALKPQLQFIPESEEQIEEVGGLEEIETNLFKHGWDIINKVKEAKDAIFKYFRDKSNRIRWGY